MMKKRLLVGFPIACVIMFPYTALIYSGIQWLISRWLGLIPLILSTVGVTIIVLGLGLREVKTRIDAYNTPGPSEISPALLEKVIYSFLDSLELYRAQYNAPQRDSSSPYGSGWRVVIHEPEMLLFISSDGKRVRELTGFSEPQEFTIDVASLKRSRYPK